MTPTTWISAVFAVFLASSVTSYIKFFGVRTRFFGVFDAENAANAGTVYENMKVCTGHNDMHGGITACTRASMWHDGMHGAR